MSRRWLRRTAFVLALILAATVGWWSSRVVLEPADEVASSTSKILSTVRISSIGETRTYGVTVSQPYETVGVNVLPGIVTQVRSSPRVLAGDVLYTVGADAVRAVQGNVPFYRSLSLGDVGDDVRELQVFLTSAGYAVESDGEFDSATAEAVAAWQEAQGVDITGRVRFGTLLAVPRLPEQVRLGDDIRLGALLSGGEPALSVRSSDPSFAIPLSSDQAADVPTGAKVKVTYEKTEWRAVVAHPEAAADGSVSLLLTAPGGGAVCRDQCSRLPTDATVSLLSSVAITPTVKGPSVPAAAIRTDASGTTYVTEPDGHHRAVTVVGSSNGVAVVRGLDQGDQVVVLAESDENED